MDKRDIVILVFVILIILLILVFAAYMNCKNTNNQKSVYLRYPDGSYAAPYANMKQIGYKNDEYVLYYFKNPNCGLCKKFDATWTSINNLFANMNPKPTKLTLQIIDITDSVNQALLEFYKVQGQLPILILKTPNGDHLYRGDKSRDSIYQFVQKYYTGPVVNNTNDNNDDQNNQ